MRFGAGLTNRKLTLFSRSSTTRRTADSLFRVEVFFHGGEIMPQSEVEEWSVLTTQGIF